MANKQPCFENRELSWIKFNQRVMEEAENISVPPLERLKFCAIFQSNLDEFFRVRVGTLYTKSRIEPKKRDSRSGMTAKEQRKAVFSAIRTLEPQRDTIFHSIMQGLSAHGLTRVTYETATVAEQHKLDSYYKREIRPLLTPSVTSHESNFPFLKNGQIYVAAQLESKNGIRLGFLPVDDAFRRMIPLTSDGKRFILAEDLLLGLAPQIFKNYRVLDSTILRVTRSADMREYKEEHDVDFRQWMEEQMKRRWKLAPVRIQLTESFNPAALGFLLRNLGIKENQVFYAKAPLDLSFVYALDHILPEPSLSYPKRVPQKPASITENKPMITQILNRDLLLSYPFESMRPFIRLLQEAAEDSSVIAISITLYRVAKNSRIIDALCTAAENGIRVTVVTELRARFDEEHNIECSRMLEKAGCHVLYGPPGYKVHSKLLLITKRSAEGVRYITQIGTGNYNEKTAQIYTDLTLMTANPVIGAEAKAVFDSLLTDSFITENGNLLVSPHTLKNQVLEMMDEEIGAAKNGQAAYIGLKMNSLTDSEIMNKLIDASCAGVKIDLVIRGICCLIPGIPGLTENITVRSIVGRYLEHNRIYFFGTEDRLRVYIGSADFMTRNTERRVEVAAPVFDPKLRERLLKLFRLYLSDNVKARIMQSDGTYQQIVTEGRRINAQEHLFDEAYKKAEQKTARALKKEETADSVPKKRRTKAQNGDGSPTESIPRKKRSAKKQAEQKIPAAQAESDAPVKRKRGRPRKHPLPDES
ncbi:MAG: polyphosphate kinase 1 [Ruminococcus sp.]|nr:polyphosphate kinase 1 [Ruminococcus sp.]